MTIDQVVEPAKPRGRGPRTKPAVTDGAPTVAKRSGRPAAPQTLDEAVTAYRAKLQAARKAVYDADGLLLRLTDLDGGTAGANWGSHAAIRDRFRAIEYDLLAAQMTVAGGGVLTHPTDKLA